jgi:hypothetical protein
MNIERSYILLNIEQISLRDKKTTKVGKPIKLTEWELILMKALNYE